MKKYYCPYCGSRALRVGQKMNVGSTLASLHKRCSSCGKIVCLRDHWIVCVVLLCSFAALICSVVFASYIFLVLFVLLGTGMRQQPHSLCSKGEKGDCIIYPAMLCQLASNISPTFSKPKGYTDACNFRMLLLLCAKRQVVGKSAQKAIE